MPYMSHLCTDLVVEADFADMLVKDHSFSMLLVKVSSWRPAAAANSGNEPCGCQGT